MGFTEHHYPTHDGLSLYYRCYGSGNEVVICLPGLTRNSKDFHEIEVKNQELLFCLKLVSLRLNFQIIQVHVIVKLLVRINLNAILVLLKKKELSQIRNLTQRKHLQKLNKFT